MPEAHDSVGSNPTVATNIHGEIGKLAKPVDLGSTVCGFDSRSRYHFLDTILSAWRNRQTPYSRTYGAKAHEGSTPSVDTNPLQGMIVLISLVMELQCDQGGQAMSELITGQVFLGAGKRSKAQVEYLHAILDEAIETLGGIQQPPSPTEPAGNFEAYKSEVLKGEERIRGIAVEIYLGLTGNKPG